MAPPVQVLFGTESEYAVSAVDSRGDPLSPAVIAQRLLERVSARTHLAAECSGVFLPSGGRLYVDAGSHPEYAAPETTDPWEGTRCALAGDRLMAALVRETAHGETAVMLRNGNVDYASETTSGSHESYLHTCAPARLRPALIAHLITRIVYTGGGGLDPFVRTHPRFVLSPRARFMRRVVALSSPQELALVDGREEPLACGYARQHVICADANRSQLSLFLRLGTTALVVALIDAGLDDGAEVNLTEPLAALETVTRDVTMRRRLRTCDGRRVSALDVQRHYLERARRHAAQLPSWSADLCDVWEDTLARLGRGPSAVSNSLDWAIKYAVFRDRAARTARRWPARARGPIHPVEPRPLSAAAAWRAELCEIDVLYGRLEPPGLFDALDRARVLRHRVEGVENTACHELAPPRRGRARIRGRIVADLGGERSLTVCGWDRIQDPERQRVLDLTDPFAGEERWLPLAGNETAAELVAQVLAGTHRDVSPEHRALVRACARLREPGAASVLGATGQHAIDLNNRACELRAANRTEEAEWLMRAALAIDLHVRPPHHPKIAHRRNNLATVLLMQGNVTEAREQLGLAWSHFTTRHDLTSARVLVVRLMLAFVTHEPPERLIGQMKTHLAIRPLPDLADVDRRWNVDRLVQELGPRIQDDHIALVSALAVVLNGDRAVESLDECRLWKETPPEPLSTPWPLF